MKNKFIALLVLFLSLTILTLSFKEVSNIEAIKVSNDGNFYYNYESKLDESYYQNVDTSSMEALRDTLHKTISQNTVRHSYDELKTTFKKTDAYPGKENYIRDLLTGEAYPFTTNMGQGENYNREHVWPKSHGFKEEHFDAYTDMHHLYPGNQAVNSKFHNDRDYNNVANPKEHDIFGNKYSNDTNSFEIRDAVKGDVARAIFYMDIRYEGDALSQNLQLNIVNHSTTSSTNLVGEIGYLHTLVTWMENDPVDDFERERNDKVYDLQKNRNPFVDHPEYADIIYNTKYQEPKLHVYYQTLDGYMDYEDLKLYKPGEKITKPNLEPTHKEFGYKFVGWYQDEALTIPFDFEKDVMGNRPLTLFAKYEFVGLTPTEEFQMLACDNSLKMSYILENKADNLPLEVTKDVTISKDGGTISGAKKNTLYKLDGTDNRVTAKVNYDKTLYDLYLSTNNKQNAYVGSGEIRLYAGAGDGTSINIEAKPGNLIKKVTTNLTDPNLSIKISEDETTCVIKNINPKTSGTLKINKISITSVPKSGETYKFTAPFKLGYRLTLTKELITKLEALDPNFKIGIKVDGVKHELKLENYNDTYFISYFKEVGLTEVNEFIDTSFYLEANNESFYTREEIIRLRDIAELYLLNYADLAGVKEYLGALNAILKLS